MPAAPAWFRRSEALTGRIRSRTSEERKSILLEHCKEIVRQLKQLKQNIQLIDTKIAFYDNPDNVRLMEQLSESATTMKK